MVTIQYYAILICYIQIKYCSPKCIIRTLKARHWLQTVIEKYKLILTIIKWRQSSKLKKKKTIWTDIITEDKRIINQHMKRYWNYYSTGKLKLTKMLIKKHCVSTKNKIKERKHRNENLQPKV